MKNLGLSLAAAAIVALGGPAEAKAGAGPVGFGWNHALVCGGSNFETCASVDFDAVFNGTNTVVVLNVMNMSNLGDVYRVIGMGDVSGLTLLGSSTDPSTGWSAGTPGLSGDGLPSGMVGFHTTGNSPSSLGFMDSIELTFTFQGDQLSSLANVVVGIHSIGFDDCSTKLGVTASGALANDNRDPNCTPTTTPEPGTMVLLGTGLAGLLGIARRRQNGFDTEDAEV